LRNKRNYAHYDRHIELSGTVEPLKDLLKQNFEIIINKNKIFNFKIGKKIHSTRYIHRMESKEISESSKLNIQFMDNGISDERLEILYAILQEKNGENLLNKYIQEFDSSIKNFKFIQSTPKLESNNKYVHLSCFGDGLKMYISILCSLLVCENGYLFIDEIDNGIYYEHFDRLWEIILKLSKETNCQVFATTHSKEMLESFARVAKKLEEKDISYTLLVKSKQQEIKSITDDYEMILDNISDGRELRG
jgi:AAA15 family ATPase/GTPase